MQGEDSMKKEFIVAMGAKRAGSKKKKPEMKSEAKPDMPQGDSLDHEIAESIADAIAMKRRKKMAEGGQVDLDNEEPGNNFYKYSEDALEDPSYDDEQLGAQPKDSNEHGEHMYSGSIADQIRRKLKGKL